MRRSRSRRLSEQQNAIAAIPPGRWAPEALGCLRNSGFRATPSQTLAADIALTRCNGDGPWSGVRRKAYGDAGAAPATPGITLTSSAISGGGPRSGRGRHCRRPDQARRGRQAEPAAAGHGKRGKAMDAYGQPDQQQPQINPQQQLLSQQAAATLGMQHQQQVVGPGAAALRHLRQAPDAAKLGLRAARFDAWRRRRPSAAD